MRSPFHNPRAWLAAGMSLWIAALACLLGCALPSFAKSGAINAALQQENPAEQGDSGLMPDMENCPHHSGSQAPTKPDNGKPAHGGAMSCCPQEITVGQKWSKATLGIVATHGFVLRVNLNVAPARFYRLADTVPQVPHSGRDTLLATQLLRI